jgi:hypothetical protein
MTNINTRIPRIKVLTGLLSLKNEPSTSKFVKFVFLLVKFVHLIFVVQNLKFHTVIKCKSMKSVTSLFSVVTSIFDACFLGKVK